MDSIAVLQSLSAQLGGRLRNKKVMLQDGSVLRKELRAIYREHKIELLGNESLVLVENTDTRKPQPFTTPNIQ
jgi:hypothetical protein